MCLGGRRGNVVLLLAREDIARDNIFIPYGCSRISHGHEFTDTRFGNMSVKHFFLRNKTNESAKFQLAIILMCVSYCEIGYFAYMASSPSYSVWKRFE